MAANGGARRLVGQLARGVLSLGLIGAWWGWVPELQGESTSPWQLAPQSRGTFTVIGHRVEGSAAEVQLQAIAQAANGEYISASDSHELVLALREGAGMASPGGGVAVGRRSGLTPMWFLVGLGGTFALILVLATVIRVNHAPGRVHGRRKGASQKPGQRRSLELRVQDGDGPPRRQELESRSGGRLLAGRDKRCSIRFEDPGVSREHLALYLQNGRVRIRDLKTPNGTWVRGRKVSDLQVALPVTIGLGQHSSLGIRWVETAPAAGRARRPFDATHGGG